MVTQLNHRSERAQTEQTVFGPFHRLNAPKFDQWGDISKGFRGKRCYVDITVKDEHGDPVRGAVVDVWHSDDVGFYDVQMKRLNGKMGLRGVLKPDAEGHVRFKTIVPKYYPVPIDGPVGELLKASARHPMRPAHIHFLVQASGYDRLVTHVFVKGDKFIDSDAVFGVRDALVRDYKKHPAGRAPDGTISKTPFYTMTYSFVMRPQPKKTKSSAKSAQSSSPRKSAKK